MNSFKTAIISHDIVWGDVSENLYTIEKALSRIEKDTDLVVLPELFSTGFMTSPELLIRYAEDAAHSHTLEQVRNWARRYNMAFTATLLIFQDGSIFNRAFFVEPSGETTFYDKKHLFSLGSESRDFTSGTTPIPVIRYRGWNIALAICYEVRFPAWLRNQGNKYDILVLPANWPTNRAYAWRHLLIARAIENQAYVVGANRSGSDDSGQYGNGDQSFIFNYLGKPIHTPTPATNIITATFDHDKLTEYRHHFPVVDDADPFKFL